MANVLVDGSVWDARDDLVTFDNKTYPRGVQHRPAGYLPQAYEEWAVFEAPGWTEKSYDLWIKNLESQEGKPYDQLGILDFVTGIVKGKYQDRNYAPASPGESKAWFCDEYAVWAAMKTGLLPPIPIPPYTLTPGSALNLFIGAGWTLLSGRINDIVYGADTSYYNSTGLTDTSIFPSSRM